MKRILCLILALATFIPFMPVLADENITQVMQVVKCSEYVSLRAKPDTSSKRLKKVNLGEFVTECEAADGDFVMCCFDGQYGYILKKYLKTTSYSMNDMLMNNQMVVKCEEYVSLRESPDKSSKRLKKVPLYGVVTGCVKYSEDWVCCEYDGKRGYILASYLEKADYDKIANYQKQQKAIEEAKKQLENNTYPAIAYPMEVVNCNEWVSLFKYPFTDSARLKKVALGELVTNCVQVSDEFIYCTYDGASGYVLKKYLAEYIASDDEGTIQSSAFEVFTDLPAYSELKTVGETVLDYTAPNGYTVLVQRATTDYEELMAVCYNTMLKPVWTVTSFSGELTELYLTEAFIAGTTAKPQLVLFAVGKGFTAYDIGEWTDVAWQNVTEGKEVSGSISYAVDADGTVYVLGYYDNAPLCINPDGSTNWLAVNTNSDIYWPYLVYIGSDYIEVFYDSCMENSELCYCVRYSKDGKNLQTEQVLKSSVIF